MLGAEFKTANVLKQMRSLDTTAQLASRTGTPIVNILRYKNNIHKHNILIMQYYLI